MNPDPQLLQFITIISLLSAVIGILFLLILPKEDKQRRVKALAFFVGGMAGLVLTFVIKNPDILESAQEHIAITLIGMVIAAISVIRVLKK